MSAELQGLISEIVGPHETKLLAAVRPDDIEHEAARVAAVVGSMEDLTPVVRTGIVAAYSYPHLSYPSHYQEQAARTVAGLTALRDTLSKAEEGVEEPVLVQLKPDMMLSGAVSSDSLVLGRLGRVTPLMRPAASLHVAKAKLATSRDVGIFPSVKEIAEDSEQNQVTILEDGNPGRVVGLEKAATNQEWVVVGHDAIIKRLGRLDQPQRLLAATAIAATSFGRIFDMRDGEYGINDATRWQVIKDMTSYVVDVATDRGYVPENKNDSPPDAEKVKYDLTSMHVLARMLKINRDQIGVPASMALEARLQGARSNRQAVKFSFANVVLGDLLRPLSVGH